MAKHSSEYHRKNQTSWGYVLGFFEATFFNATFKLVMLRLLLLAVLVNFYIQWQSMVTTPGYKYAAIVFPTLSFICIHHVASAFKSRFIPRVLDFFLVVAQMILLILPNTTPLILIYSGQNGFDSLLGVMSTMTLIGIALILIFLLACRLAAIIRHKGSNLFKPFDLLEDRPQGRITAFPEHSLLSGFSLLVGRSLWRDQFLGERSYVRVLRGFFAVCFAVAIVIYALMAIAVQPALESAFIPIKQTRTSLYNYHNLASRPIDTWDSVFQDASWIFYFSPIARDAFNSTVSLLDMINVTTYYREPAWTSVEPIVLPCGNELVFCDLPNPTIKTTCPPYRAGFGSWESTDIVISIDFANLNFGTMGSNAIAIYPSLTDDFDQMLRETTPFPLTRGVSYFATMSVRGRKAYTGREQAVSSLGLFDFPKAYLIPTIEYVVADPLALRPPGVSLNVSYLRLSSSFDSAEFRVELDQREKTVFSGFATAGGFFTFISGMFAIIFGTTFLRIIFDIKELSIFGIAQKWDRTKIVKAYLDAYPLLREELELQGPQRGVVAVMQDHLLDMKLFREVLDAEHRSASTMELVATINDEEEGLEMRKDQIGHLQREEEGDPREEAVMFLPGNSSKLAHDDTSMK